MTTLATPYCSTVTAPSNVITTPSNSVVTPESTLSDQKLSIPPALGDSSVGSCEHGNTAVLEEKSAVKCEEETKQQQQTVDASTSVNEDDDDFKKPKKLRSTGVS